MQGGVRQEAQQGPGRLRCRTGPNRGPGSRGSRAPRQVQGGPGQASEAQERPRRPRRPGVLFCFFGCLVRNFRPPPNSQEIRSQRGPWSPQTPSGSNLEKTSQPPPQLRPGLGLVTRRTPSASRGCCSTERPGSTCASDVEGHKRRPPSKVGGLCHEFRV